MEHRLAAILSAGAAGYTRLLALLDEDSGGSSTCSARSRALAEVLSLRPDFSIAKIPRLPSGRDFLVENLRKAGLRE